MVKVGYSLEIDGCSLLVFLCELFRTSDSRQSTKRVTLVQNVGSIDEARLKILHVSDFARCFACSLPDEDMFQVRLHPVKTRQGVFSLHAVET